MSDSVCHIDIESFSKEDLPKVGVYKYAEHPDTEILIVCYAFDEGPVHTWIPKQENPLPRELKARIRDYTHQSGGKCFFGNIPKRLKTFALAGKQFRAHNSQFERVMLSGNPGNKIGFPKTDLEQWYCVAVKAAVRSMPRDLGRLCSKTALDTPHKKDENGKGDMMRLTKPRKPSKHNPAVRWTPEDVPDKFFNLYSYCMDDVLTERDCDAALPDISAQERDIFLLDQKINDRGWMVDLDRTADAQYLIKKYKKKLRDRFRAIVTYRDEKTGKTTPLNPTQGEKFANWIRERGVYIENLQAQTIKDTLVRKDVPKEVRKALYVRQLHEMRAPTKYTAIERAVCADGALRGMFVVHAASTGRWSSRIVQLQNLFRPVIKDISLAVEAFALRSIAWLKFLYKENPMKLFASCIRAVLISRPGRDLLFCDFNSIEARIVAWLADSKAMLKVFHTHGLAYEYTAAKMFDMPTDLESLRRMADEYPMRRFFGKIAVLALGYQGGGNAFVKMAKQFGTDVSFEQGEEIKTDWRAANPEVADYDIGLWANLNSYAIAAIDNPGVTYKTNRLMFRVVGDWLCMRLPSGRKLYYFKPEVVGGEVRFWGVDTYTGQWCKRSMYGGVWLQHSAEGIARDLLTAAMLKLDATGTYPLLATIHDEIGAEPKEGEGSVEEFIAIMCDTPEWAAGLPVDAEGWRGKRYRK